MSRFLQASPKDPKHPMQGSKHLSGRPGREPETISYSNQMTFTERQASGEGITLLCMHHERRFEIRLSAPRPRGYFRLFTFQRTRFKATVNRRVSAKRLQLFEADAIVKTSNDCGRCRHWSPRRWGRE
jgi:hypothetical protein